jgi:hypothetical protein
MQRRKFIIHSSLASSVAFFGGGSLEAMGIHLLNAKMLLRKEEYQHLASFAKEYDAILKSHSERPFFMNKIYAIDELIERKVSKNGYEVRCRNTNGQYLVLKKVGNKKYVKILKEI